MQSKFTLKKLLTSGTWNISQRWIYFAGTAFFFSDAQRKEKGRQLCRVFFSQKFSPASILTWSERDRSHHFFLRCDVTLGRHS